jgi:hypothetical protein
VLSMKKQAEDLHCPYFIVPYGGKNVKLMYESHTYGTLGEKWITDNRWE